MWSPLDSGDEVARPFRDHRGGSLRTVDVGEGIAVTGGDDGCVKLSELEGCARPAAESATTFHVPKDPEPADPPTEGGGASVEPPFPEGAGTADANAKQQKKRKKKRKSGQAVCGMEFYGERGDMQSKLLVATRGGGLFSLSLRNHAWTDYSSWSGQVLNSSAKGKMMNIDPSSGSCIAVHPRGECAVVGTTEGFLITVSILQSTGHDCKSAFQAPTCRPVQSISFIDDSSLMAF